MTAVTFDTLKFANRLEATCVPDKQAEAEVLAEVLEVNLKKLATKEDLLHLEAATKEDLHRMEVGHRDKEAGKVYFRSMSEKLPALPACRSEEPCESPFAYAHVILTKQAYIQLKWDANYWRAEWQRVRVREQEALQRVAELKAQLRAERDHAHARIAELEGQIRDLRQQLFSQSSEKQRGSRELGSRSRSTRNRGQQHGQRGHGRRSPEPHLPVPDNACGDRRTAACAADS